MTIAASFEDAIQRGRSPETDFSTKEFVIVVVNYEGGHEA